MSVAVTLAILAATIGADGVRRLYNNYSNNNEAERLENLTKSRYEEALAIFKNQKNNMTKSLNFLGKLKLEIMSKDFSRFTDIFQSFKNVKFEDTDYLKGLSLDVNNPEVLKEIELASLNATEILTGGAAAIASGALAGVAVYGGTMALATASTGTAIATLHGVAATNAALAWLGGGSVAAGGGGMAAGAWVLGGVAVAPALWVCGFMMESNSEANLAKAKANFEKNKNEIQKMIYLIEFMGELEKISENYFDFLVEYSSSFSNVLSNLEKIRDDAFKKSPIKQSLKERFGLSDECLKTDFLIRMGYPKDCLKIDFNSLSLKEQRQLHIAVIMAQILHKVMKMPILITKNIDGIEKSDINPQAKKCIKEARKQIESDIKC